MNDTMMYQTMYNESVRETSTQKKTIEEMKSHIEILTSEMEIYKTKVRKELLRLQIKLGEKNNNDWVDY